MKTRNVWAAAIFAFATGTPVAGVAQETKVPQPVTSKKAQLAFLHGLSVARSVANPNWLPLSAQTSG